MVTHIIHGIIHITAMATGEVIMATIRDIVTVATIIIVMTIIHTITDKDLQEVPATVPREEGDRLHSVIATKRSMAGMITERMTILVRSLPPEICQLQLQQQPDQVAGE